MNYKPIISFREIRPYERELMKNAESILKELGFKFKASSPYQDDREWELLFSDDHSKEIYVQFVDESNNECDTLILIDNILTDNVKTVDGELAYIKEEPFDEEDYENFKELYENEIHNSLDEDIDEKIYNIFSDENIEFKKKILIKEVLELKNDNSDNDEKIKELVIHLLDYISDEEIMSLVYSIVDI